MESKVARSNRTARQQWLLPPPTPLVDRLGTGFFRKLPVKPGVYLMCGPEEGVLYVGKALNLRRRLGSYRVANPERFSRRIIRLLHQVTRIEYDVCADERSACLREEALIALLAPRFNRAGKVWIPWPRSRLERQLELGLEPGEPPRGDPRSKVRG